MEGFMDDGQPLVGFHPDMPDVVVGVGFSGRGFKMTPAIGEVLARFAADGGVELPLEMWDPSRFRESPGMG
jgi:glycine/D-amino acid oxidase-like deaminating enzyme